MFLTSFLHEKKTTKNFGLYWGSPKESDVQENHTEFCQISFKISSYLTDFSLQFMACMYQWHQEEEQTDQDRQYTSHRPKKSKATSNLFPSKVITMLDMLFETQGLDNERLRIKALKLLEGRLSLNVGLENGLER